MSARTDGAAELQTVAMIVAQVQKCLIRGEAEIVPEKRPICTQLAVEEKSATRTIRCIVERALRSLNGDIRVIRWLKHEGRWWLRVMVRG